VGDLDRVGLLDGAVGLDDGDVARRGTQPPGQGRRAERGQHPLARRRAAAPALVSVLVEVAVIAGRAATAMHFKTNYSNGRGLPGKSGSLIDQLNAQDNGDPGPLSSPLIMRLVFEYLTVSTCRDMRRQNMNFRNP